MCGDRNGGAPESVDCNFSPRVSPGLFGGCIRASAAWAQAEAQCPNRIRLFFIDDFVMDPAVAMGGLASFFEVAARAPCDVFDPWVRWERGQVGI